MDFDAHGQSLLIGLRRRPFAIVAKAPIKNLPVMYGETFSTW
jgi:hypothetical protein